MHDELQQLNARIEQRHWWFVARRRILTAIVRRLVPANAGNVVVDIGCGTGSTLRSLKDSYRCIGLDTSAEAVRLGRLRHPEVQFAVMEQWEDGGGFFRQANLILLNDVLEHIEDEVACFRQLVERAPPGVFFLITVPADPALWSPHDVANGHYRRYTRDRFRELWINLPVEERLLSSFNWRLYLVAKLVRTLSRIRGRAAGPANTDLATPIAPINAILQAVFAGEEKRILDAVDGRRQPSQRRSISLLAVLRRKSPGEIDRGN